jgi:hypothetical protein
LPRRCAASIESDHIGGALLAFGSLGHLLGAESEAVPGHSCALSDEEIPITL